MCNWFLPSKENDPHCLCVACHGTSCRNDDRCKEYHNWSDDHCNHLSDYMDKLSLQWGKGFLPSMPVPPDQLPSSVGSGVVTTTSSSSVCVVTFLATASVISATLFVSLAGITPVKPGRKRRLVESPREREKMLAAFEELWASGRSSSHRSSQSAAPQPLMVMPPVAVPTPVSSEVPVVVSATFVAAVSGCLSSSSRSQSHRSPEPQPVPVRSPSVPAPASRGSRSRSWSCRPSSTQGAFHPVPVPCPIFHPLAFRVTATVVREVVGEFPPLFIVAELVGFFFLATEV